MQAYKGRGEEYKLFWPKHPEFVRMAARFGATIVPFGGVGLDDGFEMLLSPQEIRAIPVLGKWLEENSKKRIPPARRYSSGHITTHQDVVLPQLRFKAFMYYLVNVHPCILN